MSKYDDGGCRYEGVLVASEFQNRFVLSTLALSWRPEEDGGRRQMKKLRGGSETGVALAVGLFLWEFSARWLVSFGASGYRGAGARAAPAFSAHQTHRDRTRGGRSPEPAANHGPGSIYCVAVGFSGTEAPLHRSCSIIIKIPSHDLRCLRCSCTVISSTAGPLETNYGLLQLSKYRH